MKAYILIIMGLILALSSVRYKNSKRFAVAMAAYMIILSAFCVGGSADLANYHYRYTYGIGGLSGGFDLIMLISRSLFSNFAFFKLICACLYVGIAAAAFRRSTTAVAAALGFLCLFPFLASVTQLRNAVMSAIVLLAVSYYVEDKKHRAMPYAIGIVIAAQVHPTAYFYLVFLLAKVNYRKFKKYQVMIIIAGVLLVEYLILSNGLYHIVSQFVSNERYLSYFDYRNIMENTNANILNWKGKSITILGQLAGYYIFCRIYKTYKMQLWRLYRKTEAPTNQDERNGKGADDGCNANIAAYKLQANQVEFIRSIMLLTFLITPYYLLNPTYFRFYKNVVPLMYILCAKSMTLPYISASMSKRIKQNTWILASMAILATIVTCISQESPFPLLNSFFG